MPTTYCLSCGCGNKYDFTLPKFCQNCGTNFAAAAGVPTPAPAPRPLYQPVPAAPVAQPVYPQPVQPRPVLRPQYDGYEYDYPEPQEPVRIPRVTKLEMEVDGTPDRQRVPLSDVMRGSKTSVKLTTPKISKAESAELKKGRKQKLGQIREYLSKRQEHSIGGDGGGE